MSLSLVPLLTDPMLSPLYTVSEWIFVVKHNFVVQGDFPVTLHMWEEPSLWGRTPCMPQRMEEELSDQSDHPGSPCP